MISARDRYPGIHGPDNRERTIVHADMDAFYASIEQLDDPKLRGKPVLVGPESARGVVLTASYEARPYRVGSAMSMTVARKRCPDAVVVPPRFDRYREVSERVMRVFDDFSPDIEPISLDEAFLDMSATTHIFGPPSVLGRKLKEAVAAATGGLSVSVGISSTKFVAKVASGYSKPDGLTIVPGADARRWLAPQPVSALWGAGPKAQARLHALGLRCIGDVAAATPERLAATFGRPGLRFHALAHGEDTRPVTRGRAVKSLSSERTLETDTGRYKNILEHLHRAADEVAARLRRAGLEASGVRIKLKRADFTVLSRQRQLSRATAGADRLYSIAAALAGPLTAEGPFRLIGLSAYDLSRAADSIQLELLEGERSRRNRELDALIDRVSTRFGDGAIRRARRLERGTVLDDSSDLDFLGTPKPDSGK